MKLNAAPLVLVQRVSVEMAEAQRRPSEGEFLLVDVGNSYLKLSLSKLDGTSIQLDSDDIEQFDLDLDQVAACILLPGSSSAAQRWRLWWQQHAPGKPLWSIGRDIPVPSVGQYASCGLDRICAGFGAISLLDQSQTAAIVIDFGTATTLNAWERSQHGGPLFMGGLILPGAQSCMDGLAQAAPGLPQGLAALIQPNQADAFAHSTIDAMQSALTIGYPAMVKGCLQSMCADEFSGSVFFTGGGLQGFGAESPWPEQWIFQKQLTALGMLLLAQKAEISI